MDRATRDKFAARTPQGDSLAPQGCWETPPAVVRAIVCAFGEFDIDLTAHTGNSLRPIYLGPGSIIGEDTLTVPWHETFGLSRGFSNPPYGAFIGKILNKAVQEARLGFQSVFLLPARMPRWFHTLVIPHASHLYFCDRRIVFFEYGKPRLTPDKKTGELRPDTAMFDSMVVVFDGTRQMGARLHVGSLKIPPIEEQVKGYIS